MARYVFPAVVSLLGAPWWGLSGQRALRATPAVAWLPAGSPMSDRSKVMTQWRRDNLVLQVGECVWDPQPHPVKR